MHWGRVMTNELTLLWLSLGRSCDLFDRFAVHPSHRPAIIRDAKLCSDCDDSDHIHLGESHTAVACQLIHTPVDS